MHENELEQTYMNTLQMKYLSLEKDFLLKLFIVVGLILFYYTADDFVEFKQPTPTSLLIL